MQGQVATTNAGSARSSIGLQDITVNDDLTLAAAAVLPDDRTQTLRLNAALPTTLASYLYDPATFAAAFAVAPFIRRLWR